MELYHLHDDLVRIRVWHQPGQRAATSHAESTGIVDQYQITAAFLDRLG